MKNELGKSWYFLIGLVLGFLACAMLGWNPFGTFPKPSLSTTLGVTVNTNIGSVVPDAGTIGTVGTLGNVIRFVTNAAAVTQIVYVYRELSNFVTAAPAATGQTLDAVTFDVYKNHYTLPLNFPRWTIGIGASLPFGSAQGAGVFPAVFAGYRFYDRWGVWAGSDFKGVQIGINILID